MEQHPIADYTVTTRIVHITSGLLKFESPYPLATTVLGSTAKTLLRRMKTSTQLSLLPRQFDPGIISTTRLRITSGVGHPDKSTIWGL